MFARIWQWLVAAWAYAKKWDLLPGKSTALRCAEASAAMIAAQPGVRKVQLFGSTSRRGDGKDIDLVVVVDDDIATNALRELSAILCTDYTGSYSNSATARKYLASRLLPGLNWWDLPSIPMAVSREEKDFMRRIYHGRNTDIFLLPMGWETNGVLRDQLEFPMKDPKFFDKIARDAKPFDPVSGEFLYIGPWKYVSKYFRMHPEYKLFRMRKMEPLTRPIRTKWFWIKLYYRIWAPKCNMAWSRIQLP